LNDIVQLAYDCVKRIAGHNAILSTIQIYDKPSNKLIFEGVFPFDEYPRVLRGLKERYSLDDQIPIDRALAPQGRIGITGRAVEKKEPQLINDVRKDPDYIIFDSRTRSELAVPLIERNKVLGVFNVESDQVGGFDRDDLETLQGLAELAVIAIDNASLYQQEEQRVRLMEAIADMSQIINASLDLNATLKAILQSTRKLIGYTAAEINFWDESKQGAVVFESDGYAGYTQEAGGFYAQDEGFTGQIVRSKQSLLIENTEDFPDIPPKVIDPTKPIRSFVGVPLLLDEGGERHFGTLELVSHIPNKYSQKDKEVLERIGVLAKVAIKNAEHAKKLQSAAYAAALAAQAIEIAHGVKSEAGAILRKLYILRDHYGLPDEAKGILKEIEGYTKSLIPQKEDYLGVLYPYTPSQSGAELDHIISRELALAEKRWAHLTIDKALNAKGLKVNISERDLKHLLQHLLHNSAKAIESASGSGNIFVRTSSTESFAFLQVEDDGPGIPDELKSRVLWEPIDKEDRMGWGLLMVRLTAERYDGSVQQVKPQVGKGTCFELRFPIVSGDEAANVQRKK
jgi:GAF domain-containing protein